MGISKRSLFKYFRTKEELLAAMELELHAQAPLYYRFFMRVLADEYDPVVRRLQQSDHERSVGFFRALMQDATLPDGYSTTERERVIDVVEWMLTGLGKRWFGVADKTADDPTDPGQRVYATHSSRRKNMNKDEGNDWRSIIRQAGTRFDGIITVASSQTTIGGELSFPVVAFGKGSTPLVIVPGLSDGLTTVEGKGRMLAYYCRKLPDEYRVYVISRPKNLPDRYSTREMAADYSALFETMGFEPGSVNLWGVSQGGMISQWIAIDHGDLLNRLCLTVTAPVANQTLRDVVGDWMALARAGEYGTLMRATMRKTYTSRYLRRYRLMMPFLGLIGRPKSFRRFLIQADSCMNHDATDSLSSIRTPTLVVGGGADEIVGRGTSERLAELIPGAQLELYPELGHGAFDEAAGCTDRIMRFFQSSRVGTETRS